MIGYVTIGTNDMERSKAFWSKLLESQGATMMGDMGRIAFIGHGMDKPFLAVCTPFYEGEASPGNGNMVSLAVDSREDVDRLYALAIERGGTDEGEPGERAPTFYGGDFRDPDGNKAAFFKMG